MKSFIRSTLDYSCPRCRKGNLFFTPFTLKTAYKMHKNCPVCNQDFEPEPGYYYGAMFISYILTGWLFILVGLFLIFVLEWSLAATIFAVLVLTVLIHNQIYRLSRSIWIHIFIKHQPNYQGINSKV